MKGILNLKKEIERKSCQKIALNGCNALIEKFWENLGTNLKSFEIFVLF